MIVFDLGMRTVTRFPSPEIYLGLLTHPPGLHISILTPWMALSLPIVTHFYHLLLTPAAAFGVGQWRSPAISRMMDLPRRERICRIVRASWAPSRVMLE